MELKSSLSLLFDLFGSGIAEPSASCNHLSMMEEGLTWLALYLDYSKVEHLQQHSQLLHN